MATASGVSLRYHRLFEGCQFIRQKECIRNFHRARDPLRGGWAQGVALIIQTEDNQGMGFGFREEIAHGSSRIDRGTSRSDFKAYWEVCPVLFGPGAAIAQWEFRRFGFPERRSGLPFAASMALSGGSLRGTRCLMGKSH